MSLLVAKGLALTHRTLFAVAGMVVALPGVDLAVAGATVLRYRLCVDCFLVVIGGASLVFRATSVGTLPAEVPRATDLTDRVEP